MNRDPVLTSIVSWRNKLWANCWRPFHYNQLWLWCSDWWIWWETRLVLAINMWLIKLRTTQKIPRLPSCWKFSLSIMNAFPQAFSVLSHCMIYLNFDAEFSNHILSNLLWKRRPKLQKLVWRSYFFCMWYQIHSFQIHNPNATLNLVRNDLVFFQVWSGILNTAIWKSSIALLNNANRH